MIIWYWNPKEPYGDFVPAKIVIEHFDYHGRMVLLKHCSPSGVGVSFCKGEEILADDYEGRRYLHQIFDSVLNIFLNQQLLSSS